MIRQPAVAGQFYESSPAALSAQVEAFIETDVEREHATGIVSPHAGLIYSGRVAGAVYSRIKIPHTFILIGPNHTGFGTPLSIMSSGEWVMPTGELRIDTLVARKLKEHCSIIEEDNLAHQMEHSLEVQLPFILHFSSEVKIVPLTAMSLSLKTCRLVGEAMADVIECLDYPVTVIASSDMSHYETDAAARRKDERAINRILAMDPEGLYTTVIDEGISMCGVVPVTTMLYAANKLGAEESTLVRYMTSGEVSGDYDHVVGYAGVMVK